MNLALLDCYEKGNRFTSTCYDEYSAFWACYKRERGFIKARSVGDLLASKDAACETHVSPSSTMDTLRTGN